MNWRRFFRRDQADSEQRQELELYVEITTDEYLAQGLSPAAAREAARRKLGNITRIQEEVYHMNTLEHLESIGRDLRHSLRLLANHKTFSCIAVLTMALGIGANTAIFAVTNAVLIKPLSYPEPQQVVGVWFGGVVRGTRINAINLCPPFYWTLRQGLQTTSDFGAFMSGAASVTGLNEPEQVRSISVSQGVLPALGVKPQIGRWFSVADDTPGAPDTVIVTDSYWRDRLGADPNALGRRITIDSRPRQLIAVMPPEFRFLDQGVDIFLPQQFEPGDRTQLFSWRGVARLKPGVTVAQANADAARLIPQMVAAADMTAMMGQLQLMPALRPLKEDVVGDTGRVLWTLMGGIGLVLLIASANVANLMLVRAESRRGELALRAALGAGWTRIARELLVESLTISILGGLAGLALAYLGTKLLVAVAPANLPRLSEISIDGTVFAFTLAVSLIAGLLFGMFPVIKYAGARLTLVSGRTIGATRERHLSRNLLLISQIALAVVLLIGSGLMIRTFQTLRHVNPGFTDPDAVQTVRISIPPSLVADENAVLRMQREILNRLAKIPGVTNAAYTDSLLMETEPAYSSKTPVNVEDHPSQPGQLPSIRTAKRVSPGTLATFGTPLLAGRDVTWLDFDERRDTVVISANMARELWGSPAAALGKRVRQGNSQLWNEIVGVAADVYDDGADKPAPTIVYWQSRRQGGSPHPRSVAFALRTSRAGTEGLLREIGESVRQVNANLPLARVQTLGAFYSRSMARTSFTLVMLGIAGAMALVLGMIGLYGVLAYSVVQRRREIGIRMALGANPGSVKTMFVRHGLITSVIGIAVGLVSAALLSRLMAALLFGVTPLDPITYGVAALVLLVAATSASYIPARRAALVDPMESLRGE